MLFRVKATPVGGQGLDRRWRYDVESESGEVLASDLPGRRAVARLMAVGDVFAFPADPQLFKSRRVARASVRGAVYQVAARFGWRMHCTSAGDEVLVKRMA